MAFDIMEKLSGAFDAVNPFDSEGRKRRAFEKLSGKVVSKNVQHDDRMFALQQLSDLGTDEAIAALFRRWDLKADKEREDRTEKEFLADLLVAKGDMIRPHLSAHLDRSINVTWPIQVLARIVDDPEVVSEILRSLAREQGKVSFKPEKKFRLIQLLSDQDDPRIVGGVAPSLEDHDETVRAEAARLLGSCGAEDARDALVGRLLDPEEDSARVMDSLCSALCEGGWPLGEKSSAVGARLVEGFKVGPNGALVRT